MPPKAKRSPDDLLVQLDTTTLQKLAFGQEINVTTAVRSELTNCIVPPPEAGIAEGMQQLPTIPIPQQAFANIKGMSGQVALLFPPNCKFTEVETQQLIPGVNPNISDDVSQHTFDELVSKLEVNMFKHLFMQLFKSQKLPIQANQLSQRQYQTMVQLNLIQNMDPKVRDTLANMFKDPKAGFKNILNYDAKLNTFTTPVTISEKILTAQSLNYKVNNTDYYYLAQAEEQTANDGEKYFMQYGYCALLNQLADALDTDLLDILNGEAKLYTRSLEPSSEQLINIFDRSVLCLMQVKNFRNFMSKALKKFFRDLIVNRDLVKQGVADLSKVTSAITTPAPASQEGSRPATKDKSKSPVKGGKNAPADTPVIEPPNNKSLFSDLKVPGGDGQANDEKLNILFKNIDALVEGLPDEIQLPVLDQVSYDQRQFLIINTFDKVLATILNTNYQVDDQENGVRIYALFRELAKEFNVMMPGITMRTYKDYQKPEKVKKKYDFMESQIETPLSDSETENPGEEKKKKVIQPLIPLPQLRGFKYNPITTQTQGKDGEQDMTGTVDMTMGMQTMSGTMMLTGMQTRVFTPKRKKKDYEPVWADSGREEDLFEDAEEDLPTICYLEFTEIQDYIDYFITYTVTNENNQVYFKQSGNIQQQAGGKQQTAIQQSVQNFSYAENLSFNNKPVLDKVQPSPLLKRYQAQITSNSKFYLLKLDKNNFDVENTVLNLFTEYAGDYDQQITHFVIYYLALNGQWRQHERTFSKSTYSKLTNIGDNVDFSQEMIVMLEYLTKDGKLYTPGARTKINGYNYQTHVGQELLFEPITNQQNSFYKNLVAKTLLMPENSSMISMVFQIQLQECQYQQGSIIAALELNEPVDGLKMTAQVISDYDTMNMEYTMFDDQRTYPFEINLKSTVNSFYLIIKQYVQRNTVQLNVKLHLIGSVDVIQEVKQLNYTEQYTTIIDVQENNRIGYNIFQTKTDPIFAQLFYVDEEAEALSQQLQAKQSDSRAGSKLGKEMHENHEIQETPESPKEKEIQEVKLVHFELPSEKELKKAQEIKAAAASAPKGGGKGAPEVETMQVDAYMDKAIKRMTKKSSNIGIYREDLVSDNQFFFFDIFRPELQEMNIQFVGKGRVKVVLYTVADSGIQLTPFSLTQTIMGRISQKMYSKEYMATADATRKQLGVQTNVQTATCDVAKLPAATASTLQLMQASADAKGAKKGAVDAQKPDAAYQQLLSGNKQATFDAILEEVVLGAPVDDKKKAAPPKKDKAPQRGFLAGLLEDLTKQVEIDRTEAAKKLDVIIYDPSNVNTANATEIDPSPDGQKTAK